MRRLAKWIAAALGLALLAGLVAAALAVRASRPPSAGEIAVAGLGARVEIRFDAHRRPFVRAATLEDALFAEGFLHATERLWQMELLRRAGRGRLAELLGASLLESDRALWRAGVPQLGARLARNADPATRARVASYVAGVNAGIESLGARPPELLLLAHAPAPWRSEDVFAAGAMVAFDSAGNMQNELLRLALAERVGAGDAAIFLPAEHEQAGFPYVVAGSAAALRALGALDAASVAGLPSAALGSNGWAVSPARSRSGAALFAFDSHDALSLPNLFYEVHLFYGAGRQIRGWSTPGLPGVINGGNENLLWGLTNIGDTQDLFLETRDPADPLRFRGPDGWYTARTEAVEIPVRGASEPERIEVVVTRNGPLVSDDPPIALRWTGHAEDAQGLDALLAMNTAQSWDEFRAAIDRHFAPSANVTYADTTGRIAFRTIGRLPVRGRGEGLVPLRGEDPDAAWRGIVPAAALPALVDPPEGFVAAANARVAPREHPVLVSADNATGYRIARIRDVIGASRAHDVDAMRRLQVDWWNGQAAALLPALLPAIAGDLADPAERAARDALAAWSRDPVNAPDLAASLVFERWYRALADALFAERLGADLHRRLLARGYVLNHALDRLVASQPDSAWWRGARDALVRRTFTETIGALAREHGGDASRWRWDAEHRVAFRHELGRALPLLGRFLDRGPAPWGGGTSTVGRASHRYDEGPAATHAATVRVVAEMTDPIRLLAVIPGGQSGHPASPHYADQLPLWLAGELVPIAATPDGVGSATLSLTPSAAPPRSGRR